MLDANTLSAAISNALLPHGFRQVTHDKAAATRAVWLGKRQTWNTNRGVVVVQPAAQPPAFAEYIGGLARDVAVACGYIPVLWGIGIQVIVVADGVLGWGINPAEFVSRVDNQWAIVQSLFLVDPVAREYASARTWGQFVTGKFQDAIEGAIMRDCGCRPTAPPAG